MSRDQRKISRSFEERNILASTTRVSQISQTDNELKQKLEAIDTSYKLSNKRISNETRELRGILHSLQKELKVSKGTRGEYIPSIFEQRQARSRRITVSSVPSEDRKEVGVEKSQQGHGKEREQDGNPRHRSGSFPPSTHAHYAKKIKTAGSDDVPNEIIQAEENDVFDKQEDHERDVVSQEKTKSQKTQEILSDFNADRINPQTQNRTQFLGNGRDELGTNRRISQAGSQRIFGRYSTEQKQQQQQCDGRKHSSTESSQSFSKAFRGRFVASQDTTLSTSFRKTSRTQQSSESAREVGLNRQRPSIVEEYWSVPNQRKISLNVSQYPWQRKRSIGNRGDSPSSGLQGRLDVREPERCFDSLSENFGGRKVSVANGRIRRISRATGLPPLKEEQKPAEMVQETPTENWRDLARCRYLRKEENELSIDDVFDKK